MKIVNRYSKEAEELAFAWASVCMPLDSIAENYLALQLQLAEKDKEIEELKGILEGKK